MAVKAPGGWDARTVMQGVEECLQFVPWEEKGYDHVVVMWVHGEGGYPQPLVWPMRVYPIPEPEEEPSA